MQESFSKPFFLLKLKNSGVCFQEGSEMGVFLNRKKNNKKNGSKIPSQTFSKAVDF